MTPTAQPTDKLSLWQMIALSIGGVVVAIGLVLLIFMLFPQLLPQQDRVRGLANQTLDIEFYYADGDLFAWLPGKVRPPEENRLVAQYSISWDSDGFRVPAIEAESYPIAVLGDSFTEGPNVGLPYPDGIAQALGVPVRNYGYRAYGPQENAQVATEFLGTEERTWVLYGHFSGNDIYQAEVPPEALVQERTPVQLIPFLAGRAVETVNTRIAEQNADGNYDYPMPVVVGSNFYEMGILMFNTWWLAAPEEGFAATQSYRVIGETLDTARAQVSDETCLAFVFIPPKGAIYFPYVTANQDDILAITERPVIGDDGLMTLQPHPYNRDELDLFLDTLDDQRDAMAQLAEERGWYFIDLLDPMRAAGTAGDLLYYRYDTHWNQAGHDLATQVIADFMREHEDECPLS